jgi:hypothetical protein
MWKSCAREKHKFFFWLLLSDRLNTRELLKRKNMDLQDYTCVLCSTNSEESLLYLFFDCPFSKWCWRMLSIHWNTSLTPQDTLIRGHRQFNCRIFREVIMVAGWTIYCHRNANTFDGASRSLRRWMEAFKDEFALIIHRAKPSTKVLLSSWLSSL